MKTTAAVVHEVGKLLEQVNQGYEDLLAGRNIRGVVVHEHEGGG